MNNTDKSIEVIKICKDLYKYLCMYIYTYIYIYIAKFCKSTKSYEFKCFLKIVITYHIDLSLIPRSCSTTEHFHTVLYNIALKLHLNLHDVGASFSKILRIWTKIRWLGWIGVKIMLRKRKLVSLLLVLVLWISTLLLYIYIYVYVSLSVLTHIYICVHMQIYATLLYFSQMSSYDLNLKNSFSQLYYPPHIEAEGLELLFWGCYLPSVKNSLLYQQIKYK